MAHCSYLSTCCQQVLCKLVCNLYKLANYTVKESGDWRKRTMTWRPNPWPTLLCHGSHQSGYDSISQITIDIVISSSSGLWVHAHATCLLSEQSHDPQSVGTNSIVACSWSYLWQLEIKNRDLIVGPRSWNSSLERRPWVWAPGRGSFTPVATFLKLCSWQTCTGYTPACITLTDKKYYRNNISSYIALLIFIVAMKKIYFSNVLSIIEVDAVIEAH